ncbi:MAG TPA: CBS domain-containing protein, partial [Candidatus Dormibacteraeota bacterium]|nr:CBS domain-containing protein [Candidatus Dormibacteraeota bacterium]
MSVKVKDLPPGRLLSVSPVTKLADVARDMRVHDSDSVAVIDDARLVGIITERDLVRAIA